MTFYIVLFIISCSIGLIGGITTGIMDMKRGKHRRRRKRQRVLGGLGRASKKLERFYVRPKHRGVMCSGPRRGKR